MRRPTPDVMLIPTFASRARDEELIRARDTLCRLIDCDPRAGLSDIAAAIAAQTRQLRIEIEQLRTAKELAEEASIIKDNVLYTMSHDLKTPLTSMQLSIRLIERDARLETHPELGEGAQRVWRSSRRVVHLVDAILEWSRVKNGRCEIASAPFAIDALLQEMVDDIMKHAHPKHLDIHVRCASTLPSEIVSDQRMVRLLCSGLLNRAMQRTRTHEIEVSIAYRDELFLIEVKDRVAAESANDDSAVTALTPEQDTWSKAAGPDGSLYILRDLARAIGGDLLVGTCNRHGRPVALQLPNLPVRPCP